MPLLEGLEGDQLEVAKSVQDWVNSDFTGMFIRIGGFAGTGKTFLLAKLCNYFYEEEKLRVNVATPTGAAAERVRAMLRKAEIRAPEVSTLHKFLYGAPKEVKTTLTQDFHRGGEDDLAWKLKSRDEFDCDVIIVDESSMVSKKLFEDLMSLKIPVLFFGDHAQLPPVEEGFNLMDNPPFRLEQIRRQAAGNPIIELSRYVREEGRLPYRITDTSSEFIQDMRHKGHRDKVQFAHDLGMTRRSGSTVTICATNADRVLINRLIRHGRGLPGHPVRGDSVICLRNKESTYFRPEPNDRDFHKARLFDNPVFNGMRGTILRVQEVDQGILSLYVYFKDSKVFYASYAIAQQFNIESTLSYSYVRENYAKVVSDRAGCPLRGSARYPALFDYAYAITCHKSQGSQWDTVFVVTKRSTVMDNDSWKRWLYTAVTRSSRRLVLL